MQLNYDVVTWKTQETFVNKTMLWVPFDGMLQFGDYANAHNVMIIIQPSVQLL